MTNTNFPKEVDLSALTEAGTTKAAGLTAWNPMEHYPKYGIGKEIVAGTTITAYYVGNDVLGEDKIVVHCFRTKDTGKLFGIWSVAALANMTSKLDSGELVSITYTGKGENSAGRQQHFFEFQRGLKVGTGH